MLNQMPVCLLNKNVVRKAIGADAIVTFDQPFINNYYAHFDELQERLDTMTINLPIPFSKSGLPTLMQPAEILSERL
ncbi:hypothetical protein FJZ31_15525 [Candidatus Poribacteria bacterium]|nr:hypothetical protein [Candidatus Poribacteria bacterium]